MTEKADIIRSLEFDKKGWDISLEELYLPDNYALFKNSDAELIERTDNQYCCLFYLTGEFRMLCYAGLICVYKDKADPKVIFNSRQWFSYQFSETLYYCGKYLIIRKNEMYFQERKQVFSPFVIIDLESRTFSILDFDFTSMYYGVDYVDADKLKLKLNSPTELKSLRVGVENYDGKIIDLSGNFFLPLDQFDNEIKKYSDTKETEYNNTLPQAGRKWWQKLFDN